MKDKDINRKLVLKDKDGVETIFIFKVSNKLSLTPQDIVSHGTMIAIREGIKRYTTIDGRDYTEVNGSNSVKGFNAMVAVPCGFFLDIFQGSMNWQLRIAKKIHADYVVLELARNRDRKVSESPLIGTKRGDAVIKYSAEGDFLYLESVKYCDNCGQEIRGIHQLELNEFHTKVAKLLPFRATEETVNKPGSSKLLHLACAPKDVTPEPVEPLEHRYFTRTYVTENILTPVPMAKIVRIMAEAMAKVADVLEGKD